MPAAAAGRRQRSAAIPRGNAQASLQVERGLPRRGGGWRSDGEPEAREDRLEHLGLGDRGNDCSSPATFLAPQNIFSEGSLFILHLAQ